MVLATVDRPYASPNTTLTFTALTIGGTGIISYNWGFGDGSTGSAREISHAYALADQYTVSLTVLDSVGGGASTSLTVSIAPLTVTVISTVTSVKTDETIIFTAFATGGSGPPYGFLWEFGDGNSASGPTVSHAYISGGKFTPSVTVTPGGAETTDKVILHPIDVAGADLSPSTSPPYFEVGVAAVAAVALAVGTVTAVRRGRRRRRWGPRPR